VSANPRRVSRLPAVAVLLVALLLLGACQPVDSELGTGVVEDDVPTGEAGPARGAPTAGSALPDDLGALLAEHAGSAAQWQGGATPVEVVATLDGDRWVAASITYLAPDADRFLLISTGPEGTNQQRPTLATLSLEPVPDVALADVPPLPELAQPPVVLVEDAAAALEGCDAGDDVAVVVYATGAPASWDGERWTEEPAWTAVLSTEDGQGAVVDPVTGELTGRGCLAPG
jgi:hypothetical protein